jgi:hypothetical protein
LSIPRKEKNLLIIFEQRRRFRDILLQEEASKTYLPPLPATHPITSSVLTVGEDSPRGPRTDTSQNVKTSSPIKRDRISDFNQETFL